MPKANKVAYLHALSFAKLSHGLIILKCVIAKWYDLSPVEMAFVISRGSVRMLLSFGRQSIPLETSQPRFNRLWI